MPFIKKHWIKLLLGFLILCYSAYFSYFTILRYQTLYASYFDLGIMHQTVFNTFKALQTGDFSRFLEFTDPLGSSQIKRMAFHNDIILALLAPFYFLSATPATLLVIQTVVLALGAWVVFLIARIIFQKFKHTDLLAFVFGFSYLMNPVLQRANIFDFHAVTLSTTFILCVFYFWLKKRNGLSFLFLILSLMTKEQVSLTTGFFGLYILFIHKKESRSLLFPLLVLTTSIFWFAASVFFVIPYFRGDDHFALARYRDFGDTPGEVLFGFFKNPTTVLQRVFNIDTYRYLLFLLGPLGFLSVLSPIVLLISAPEFAINLLSSNWNMRNIIYQYTAVIQPFIFLSTMFGARALIEYLKKRDKKKDIEQSVGVYILIATLFFAFLKGPLPFALEKNIHPLRYPQKEKDEARKWSERLQSESISITTTGQLSPFFTNRRYFYNFSDEYYLADYVVLRLNEIYNYPEKKKLILVYEKLVLDPNYKRVYQVDNFEVYKKIK